MKRTPKILIALCVLVGASPLLLANSYIHNLIDSGGALWSYGQKISRTSTTVTEVFTMSDFPAAVAGVITLPSGKYTLRDGISTSDRFELEAGSIVTIQVEDSHNIALTYTGEDTLFTGSPTRFALDKFRVAMTGTSPTLIEQTGGALTIANGRVDFTSGSSTIGTHVGGGPTVIRHATLNGFGGGITLEDVLAINVDTVLVTPYILSTGTAFILKGTSVIGSILDTLPSIIGPNGALLYIDPIMDKPVNIFNASQVGPGDFFQASTKDGVIASVADASIVAASVTAVADNGSGKARFTSTAHGLSVGEMVKHTTFTESTYNGTSLAITSIPTADTYDINAITYIATDTGQLDADTVEVSDVAHGLVDGDRISIEGTINYGLYGYKVFNNQTDTFEVNAVWVNTETGTWNNGSQIESGRYVVAVGNGSQIDSHTHGEVLVSENTSPTDIIEQGTFVDINLNGQADAGDNDRFTLSNYSTGELRYDGVTPAELDAAGLVAAYKSGSTSRFDFRLLLNGSPLPSPHNVDIPMEVKTALVSTGLTWSVHLAPGDKLRMQVANIDGTDDLIINSLKLHVD